MGRRMKRRVRDMDEEEEGFEQQQRVGWVQ